MKRICLTGGIACGKSLLSRFLNELGVETIDADDIVHELVPADDRRRLAQVVFRDPAARKALEARLHPLVRARIEEWFKRSEVFGCLGSGSLSDGEGAAACNSERGAFDGRHSTCGLTCDTSTCDNLARLPNPNTQTPQTPPNPLLRLAVIPLLFEVHWEADYDIILCVVSSRENQIERMTTTRGYTREEAEARLAAQMSVEEKAARSQYVIRNDGSPEQLKDEAARLVAWLKEQEKT